MIKLKHLTIALATLALSGTALADTPLPADSLYRITAPLTDTHGKALTLQSFAGKPLVVSMFYGDCHTACPIVLETIRQTIDALPPATAKQVAVLLVSFDPQRDAAGRLDELYASHHLPRGTVTLAVSDNDAHTRELAVALGIKYRRLGNGEVNHSTRLMLLDKQGRPIAHSERIGPGVDEGFLKVLGEAAS